MLIPATRFKRIPEDCPVRWGCIETHIIKQDGDNYVVGTGARVEPSHLWVWLGNDAIVRAFAPSLIAQLVPIEHLSIIAAVPDNFGNYHLCIVYVDNVGGLGVHIRGYRGNRARSIIEPTLEKCLRVGLTVALDTATATP